jgi:hypothetical protein
MNPPPISPILSTIEDAYAEIRRRHPDAGPAAIVVYLDQRSWGSITFNAWTVAGNGSKLDQIHINSALLQDPPALLGTLIHEACHSIARTRKIQDVSRGGRYHNHHFKQIAEELGLTTDTHPTIGITTGNLLPEIEQTYSETLIDLYANLTLYQELPGYRPGNQPAEDQDDQTPEEDEKEEPNKNRQIKAVCQCEPPRIIRASRSTLEAAPIICGACAANFDVYTTKKDRQ